MNETILIAATIVIAVATVTYTIVACLQILQNRHLARIQNFITYCKRFDDIWGQVPQCVTSDRVTCPPGEEVEIQLNSQDWYTDMSRYTCCRAWSSQAEPLLPAGYFTVEHGILIKLLNRYIDMCYEEWRLATSNDIDRRDIDIWERGIKSYLERPSVVSAWKATRSYYAGPREREFYQKMNVMAGLPIDDGLEKAGCTCSEYCDENGDSDE